MNVTSAIPVSDPTPTPPVKTETSTKSATSDFKTFLTLLTTQLKNQDPLKPLESSQFVSQLASFSAVEQQVRTNDELAKIQDLLGGSPAAGLTSWIGLDVRISSDANFDGKPISAFVKAAGGADRADLVVTNEAGQIVERVPLDLATDTISWSGNLPDGTTAPNGKYQLSVESFQAGNMIDTHQAPIYLRVREARIDAGATLLVLSDGQRIPADEVSAMREATI